jgi:hypothetical protein
MEETELFVDEGPQGWVPLRIVRPLADDAPLPRPAVVFVHATGTLLYNITVSLRCSSPSLQPRAHVPAVNRCSPLPTGESMDHVRHKQELYARLGFVTAALDARCEAQRTSCVT